MPRAEGPRAGYRSVTPRIVVCDVAAQVDFLRAVFDASGDVDPARPAEIRIGDSLIMVTSAATRDLFPGFFYVYVDDADMSYQRALAAGATTWRRRWTRPTAIDGRWCATRSGMSSRSHTDSRHRDGAVPLNAGSEATSVGPPAGATERAPRGARRVPQSA